MVALQRAGSREKEEHSLFTSLHRFSDWLYKVLTGRICLDERLIQSVKKTRLLMQRHILYTIFNVDPLKFIFLFFLVQFVQLYELWDGKRTSKKESVGL